MESNELMHILIKENFSVISSFFNGSGNSGMSRTPRSKISNKISTVSLTSASENTFLHLE